MKKGDTVALVACSNGLKINMKPKIDELVKVLSDLGLKVKLSPYIYAKNSCFNASSKDRADALIKFYEDKEVKAIFDISGGDLANGILEYLDFEIIKNNEKLFFGFSDLTVILNSIYSRTGVKTYNYQIRNLVGKFSKEQRVAFKETFLGNKNSLFDIKFNFYQGKSISGIVVGGNIRCLLKLAGTKYMPDFSDKVIFLEALSGDVAKMATYLTQLKNIGAFNSCRGILLGTFTEMEREGYNPDIIDLVKDIVNDETIPIAKTSQIGHGDDSRCMAVGEYINI